MALPGLGIPAIKGKMDTGARTSSLHTFLLETFTEGGAPMVRFGLHPLQRREDIEVFCTAAVVDRRMTSDSGGHREMRYIISTTLSLGGMVWTAEVNLTNREDMLFRFLVGRTAMHRRLVIDPARSYVHGRELSRVYRRPAAKRS